MKKKNKESSYILLNYYIKALKKLHEKYLLFENSYALVCINNLIFTENCHIVARFKDFLYYDDSTEFFHKFFQRRELKNILLKACDFYAKYCKVFPNYMILPENKFLYKNLRKKQKLIDEFNEIKKEEEENRKHIKLNKNSKNERDYILFSKKVQESIEKYRPSFTQSTIIINDYINNSNKKKNKSKILNDNSFTISLNYNNSNNFDLLNDLDTSELTLVSMAKIINTIPNKKDELATPKKDLKSGNIISPTMNGGNNVIFTKKFFSHYQNIKSQIVFENSKNNKTNINEKKGETINKENNNIKLITKKNLKNNSPKAKTAIKSSISPMTKTAKDKNNKNNVKSNKSNIAKKKLFFTNNTEKIILNKKPANHTSKKVVIDNIDIRQNSNKKDKKNLKDIIIIKGKVSPSPPGSKLNLLKRKMISNSNNVSPGNNLVKNKLNGEANNTKEIISSYKIMIKTNKNNHFSHDINKNKSINSQNKKTQGHSKYISPVNRKKVFVKTIKTPVKIDINLSNKYQNIFSKTKQDTHVKMQNFITKIINKENPSKKLIGNKPNTKQNIVQ